MGDQIIWGFAIGIWIVVAIQAIDLALMKRRHAREAQGRQQKAGQMVALYADLFKRNTDKMRAHLTAAERGIGE